GDTIALVVFVIASLTDFLDGYIARSRNLVTNFGKFIDPLADKLLVTAAFLCFIQLGEVSAWVVFVILAREFIVSIFRAIAAADGKVIAASIYGKFKTVTQMIAIIILLLNNYPFSLWNVPMDMIMVYIATAMTLISGLDYIVKNKEVLMEK
ncbi:MAG: CDP-diacylglycerol--glycerol-3-phosphate 3-phosphatidyltransferase, partial [Clostridia bacterium]|nr:CDP-diacylglycerol--glycerol-3-phosphate 3-phosphatidyltransferase [Clostridia bacterium]